MDALSELIARHDITQVVIRYATGIDMRDWDLYRTCFTDELETDFSTFRGIPSLGPADDWVGAVRSAIVGFDSTQHLGGNHVITFASDNEATCVSYVHALHYIKGEPVETVIVGGYYTNSLVRTAEGWKIRRCQLTVTYTTGDQGLFALARKRGAAQ